MGLYLSRSPLSLPLSLLPEFLDGKDDAKPLNASEKWKSL